MDSRWLKNVFKKKKIKWNREICCVFVFKKENFFLKKTGIFANSPFLARKSDNIDMTNMARMETAKSYNVNNLFFIRENTNIHTLRRERAAPKANKSTNRHSPPPSRKQKKVEGGSSIEAAKRVETYVCNVGKDVSESKSWSYYCCCF